MLFYSLLYLFNVSFFFFFFNDTATTEIYTLSLHDALPIAVLCFIAVQICAANAAPASQKPDRSEEHTSELQSRGHLVCRLLLEKKSALRTRFTSPLSGRGRPQGRPRDARDLGVIDRCSANAAERPGPAHRPRDPSAGNWCRSPAPNWDRATAWTNCPRTSCRGRLRRRCARPPGQAAAC